MRRVPFRTALPLRFELLDDRIAPSASIVRDINTTPLAIGGFPDSITTVGSLAYFSATDATHGRELWKSDGTSSGTMLVADLRPGSGSSDPTQLFNHNGILYFVCNDPLVGKELWKSDGTSNGTVLVADINAGLNSSYPSYLTSFGSTLLFFAINGANNRELWRSDGASSGTNLVREINPTGSASPHSLTVLGAQAYFSANDGTTGVELWRTDGTSAGTSLVKDINPVAGTGSNPANYTVNGVLLLFTANTGTTGIELWKTDGTSAGTQLVADIFAGAGTSNPQFLTNAAGLVYFAANDGPNGTELWRSDGTSSGTVLVAFINPGSASANPRNLINISGTLFFHANDSTNGYELWRSNGTAPSTKMVRNININAGTSSTTIATALMHNLNGTLIFVADGGLVPGRELWKSDGTSSGTTLVRDIWVGTTSSDPSSLATLSNTVVFRASDGIVGPELWKSDGTSFGTVLVRDLRFENVDSVGYLADSVLVDSDSVIYLHGLSTALNGTLYFSANNGTSGFELWTSDGTSTGTQITKDLQPGATSSQISELMTLGDKVYFAARNASSNELLYQSDGTSSGTYEIGFSVESYGFLTAYKGLLNFTASYSSEGAAFWMYDGAPFNFTYIENLSKSVNISGTPPLVVNDRLFFAVANFNFSASTGIELWVSDGTPFGTHILVDLNPGIGDSNPTGLTAVESQVFFQANTPGFGTELWTTDGLPSGTRRVRDVNPGSAGSNPAHLTAFQDRLCFSAKTLASGRELWVSDGTSSGTTLLREINLTGSADPHGLTLLDDRLLFFANDNITGFEPWITDGTSSGTQLLKDIYPGSLGSTGSFTLVTSIDGIGYFTADDGVNGNEIWRTDGTPEGTYLLAETYPGSGDGLPQSYLALDGELLFTAVSETAGRELWKLDGGLPPVITVPARGVAASVTMPEHSTTGIVVAATDPNNQTVTYSLLLGGDGALFEINPATGEVRPLMGLDFEFPTDSNGDNQYIVAVQASNGLLTDTQTITITVTDQSHSLPLVYVNDNWAALPDATSLPDADPFTPGNQPATIGVDAFAALEHGIDAVATNGTLNLFSGLYIQPAILALPFSLRTPSGTAFVVGGLSGPFGITKTGNGTLSLGGVNTFTGAVTADRGTLMADHDDQFGNPANPIVLDSLATLRFDDETSTARTIDLNGGTWNVAQPVFLDGATIAGGTLLGVGGPGNSYLTTSATAVATFINCETTAGLTLESLGNDVFSGFENNGLLTTTAGKSVTFENFTNTSSGRLTLNGATSTSLFQTNGQATIAGNLSNSLSALVFGGGSVTTINSGVTVNIGPVNAYIGGGLVKNLGTFGAATPSIVVDFNGRLSGTGTFGSVVTINGGVFAPGASPGTATTHQLNLNGGGTLEFEVANASGTPGLVSGWDLVNVQPTAFNPAGLMNYTSTPTNKYLIQLRSRFDDGIGNTPGNIANFNTALPYAWKFADGSNPLTGSSGTFNAANFQIDTTGFSNAFTGGFSVELREGGKNLYVVYTPVAGPIVTSFVVNSGAIQRSRLTTIQVNFAAPVDAATLQPTGAITLTRTAATGSGTVGTIVDTSSGLIVSPAIGMVSSVTLTFANINSAGVNFGSLADGRWRLAIPSASFQSTLNDPILRRLFGDADNNGTVDGSDLGGFGAAFGSSGVSPFDFNNDLTVDALDFGEFGNRFGVTL